MDEVGCAPPPLPTDETVLGDSIVVDDFYRELAVPQLSLFVHRPLDVEMLSPKLISRAHFLLHLRELLLPHREDPYHRIHQLRVVLRVHETTRSLDVNLRESVTLTALLTAAILHGESTRPP